MSSPTLTPVDLSGAGADDGAAPRKGKKKLVLLLAPVLLVVLGGGGWFFLLRDPGPPPPPVPGEIAVLEPISINLAGGHYLKLGMALQGVEGAKHEVDGSKAKDRAISLFSGRPMAELSSTKGREHLKEELVEELKHDYHDEVIDVYFTEFVMQ